MIDIRPRLVVKCRPTVATYTKGRESHACEAGYMIRMRVGKVRIKTSNWLRT